MKNQYKLFGSLSVMLFVLLALSTASFAQSPMDHGGPGRGGLNGVDHNGRGNRGHTKVIDKNAVQVVVAEALGLTTDDLATAKADGKSIATLAEEQGVALADVEAVITAEVTTQVEQAVADETITQEKADALLERLANMDLTEIKSHRGNGHHGNRGHNNIFDRDAIQAVTAEALGVTIEDLDVAKDEGKTLATLVEEKEVLLEDVVAAIKAEMTAQVEQALADETITQEKADALLERIANKDISTGHSGHGHHGDRNKTDDSTDPSDTDTSNTTDDNGTISINSVVQEGTSLYLPLVMAQ